MKVLFINPNNYLAIGITNGIAILSTILKQKGHEVGLFDFTFIKPKEYIAPTAVNKRYSPTPYTLDDLVANDPVQSIAEAFKEKLREFKPDLIAVSVMTQHFDKITDLFREVKPPCKVIVGGVHATICPEDVFANDFVDFVCVGEGSGLLPELCDCLEKGLDYSKIKNLGFRKDGEIHINELRPFANLDEIPNLDWKLFDERHLFRPFMGKVYKGSFYVMSRGCPDRCTYCVNWSLREVQTKCGQYFRYQSPSTTARQLSFLKKECGTTWFKFGDDSLMLLSESYLEELAEHLKPLDIHFGCSIRPETVTKRKIEILKSMGCVAATIGIESGNEEIRKNVLNRRMTNEQIENAIFLLKEGGLRVSTFNMIGLPGERRENVFETIELNKKVKADETNAYIIYPHPHTEISRKYNIKFRGPDGRVVPYSKASSFALSQMPPEEVEGLLRAFNLYFKLPKEMWPIVKLVEKKGETPEQLSVALYDYIYSINK
ncbi:MAG: radical SAM protein [Patescibacteria group bacterium]|nr:radical SAM protein [Patescibacteria group bacterium]